jgi:hypothetical protein
LTVSALRDKNISSDFTLHTLLPLPLGIVALAFIALGLYGLIRRRAFVIRARWMLVLVIVAMSPQVILLLLLIFGENRNRSGNLLSMLLISTLVAIAVVIYFALIMRGYMVFGTTQRTFRDALVAALSGLNLKYQETLSSIQLPTVGAELQVAVQGWIGTGQLRLRGGDRTGLLAEVASGMKAYFDSEKVETNMTSVIAYVIAGILMSAMVVHLMLMVR